MKTFFNPPEQEFSNEDFVKSANEKRIHYSYFLPNGLQVLLVSDKEAQKAAASLNIAVGSGNNPRDTLGIAHYLEHMLFLGTRKYPEIDNFQQFIREHGGGYNAYTSYENTNYFFDIQSEQLEEALDRFSDFFVAPLFNIEFAERERNVVDSEYHLGLKDDGRRYYAILQEIFNPNHPISLFSVGNKETLRGDAQELREKLIRFYDTYYKPNLMKLVVYGKEPIEQLKQMVETRFGSLSKEEKKLQAVTEPLFASGALPARLQFRPVQEKRYLDYYFPIEPQEKNFRSKPAYYIEHLLDDRSDRSLYRLLKDRGWTNDLGGSLDISLPEAALFNIYVGLTPEGENHITEITRLIFHSIRLIEREGIVEWRFNELRDRSRIGLKYKQTEDALHYARALSRRMQDLPTPRILSNSLWDSYEPKKIKSILKDINPRNMLMVYVSPQAKISREEEYYKVGYDLQPLSHQELALYSQPPENIAISLPQPNKLLSSQLDLIDYSRQFEQPHKLPLKNINAWYLFDNSFRIPKVRMKVLIQPTQGGESPKESIHARLLRALINEQLNKVNQAANFAGYGGSVYNNHYGFRVSLSGYNDKFADWMDQFLKSFFNYDYSERDFNRIKENIARNLKNSLTSSPPARLADAREEALLSYKWNEELLAEELKRISLPQLKEYASAYFTDVRMRSFIAGNLPQQDAERLMKDFTARFKGGISPLGKASEREKLIRFNYQGPFLLRTTSVHDDSAIEILFQAADYAYETRARTALLAQILQPLFFQQLRTEQELGYRVSAYYTRMHELPGIVFLVQSNRKHSYILHHRIQSFIADAIHYLEDMPEGDFEDYKRGIINNLLEEPKRFDEMVELYWHQIHYALLDFDDRQRAANAIEGITKEALIDYYQTFFNPHNSITMLTDTSLPQEGTEPQGKWIHNLIDFKKDLL